MSTKQAALLGSGVGLITSVSVLILFWFGVSGVLRVGETDLMYLLWPSSIMLVGGWRTTIPGMMITGSSIAINCLMYAAIALVLRVGGARLAGVFARASAR